MPLPLLPRHTLCWSNAPWAAAEGIHYLSIWFSIIQMLVLFYESFFLCFVPYYWMDFAWHTEGKFAIIPHNKGILIPFSILTKKGQRHELADWIAHGVPCLTPRYSKQVSFHKISPSKGINTFAVFIFFFLHCILLKQEDNESYLHWSIRVNLRTTPLELTVCIFLFKCS